MEMQKKCSRCKKDKDTDQFARNRASKRDGLNWYCLLCASEFKKTIRTSAPTKIIPENKVCKGCKKVKDGAEFRKNSVSKDGLENFCLLCERDRYLRKHYNLTLDKYLEMLEGQSGGCAICSKTPEENGRWLAVDHDHECCSSKSHSCGKCVRGLLCVSCNAAIAWFKDDENVLVLAAEYIKNRSME